MKYLIFILVFLFSCKSPKEISKDYTWEEINNWYFKTSPTFTNGFELRENKDEKRQLEKTLKIKHNLPENYILKDEENKINFIDTEQAIFTIDYIFETSEKKNVLVTATYYYDDSNTPIPILLKLTRNFESTYSIIKVFD